MDKNYRPQNIEQNWYQTWEQNGYFAPSGNGPSFSQMIPPPNVTGSLHMGHAFQHTIMDALTRYQRMQGKNSLWQVGTDHAGIATQMVVERKLAAEGKSRLDLGRDAFIDKIWEWKEESGGTITKQMRRLGNSVDWDTERFTMDPGFTKAVQEVFVRLYKDGLLYRGKRLVNWDPKLHTAISDLEVENKEVKGKMWHLRYPLADGVKTADGKDYLVVATTRPETVLGDTGVAVNPEDPRYKDLIGKEIILPLVNRRIPIVGDEHADMEKGTGCVKITPAHDFNDYEVWSRHKDTFKHLLHGGLISILDKDANIKHSIFDDISWGHRASSIEGTGLSDVDSPHLQGSTSDEIPKKYHSMERFAARREVVADFEAMGLLEGIEENAMTVPYGDRSGVVIEPMLTDQWYVDARTLAKPAIEAVEDGRIKFVPQNYENMYFSWMRDIQDWCVSRQLWWGHRIPAWYDKQGNVYVGQDEATVRAENNLGDIALTQDNDVLDTWFSSALWTFGTLGWPGTDAETIERLKSFHPTDVLVTGFDIIFFWVARMIMMTMHFMKDEDEKPQVPFKTVYVTGLIRDDHGQKMSKSKGNVIDPLDMIDGIELDALIEKRTGNMMQPQLAEKIKKRTEKEFPEGIATHGTDALRFTLAALASTGRDINWDMKRLEGYRNFANKIWNASRYVLMNTEGEDCGQGSPDESGGGIELSLADRWIVSKLQSVESEVARHFDQYRFDLASQTLYDFIWNEYCDWYLELSKPVLWDDNASAKAKRGTRRTLVRVLEVIMRLIHPLMPYLSEEIWQAIKGLAGKEGDTIMLQPFPTTEDGKRDQAAEANIEWLKQVIMGVRTIRGEMNIAPAKLLPVFFHNGTDDDQRRLEANRRFLTRLANLESITWLNAGDDKPMSATALAGKLEILVPMAGLIDKDAELARLQKEIDKIAKDFARVEGKLNNPEFVDKAPAEVVDKEKARMADMQTTIARLEQRKEEISRL